MFSYFILHHTERRLDTLCIISYSLINRILLLDHSIRMIFSRTNTLEGQSMRQTRLISPASASPPHPTGAHDTMLEVEWSHDTNNYPHFIKGGILFNRNLTQYFPGHPVEDYSYVSCHCITLIYTSSFKSLFKTTYLLSTYYLQRISLATWQVKKMMRVLPLRQVSTKHTKSHCIIRRNMVCTVWESHIAKDGDWEMRGCLQLMGYRRKGFMAKLNLEVGLKRQMQPHIRCMWFGGWDPSSQWANQRPPVFDFSEEPGEVWLGRRNINTKRGKIRWLPHCFKDDLEPQNRDHSELRNIKVKIYLLESGEKNISTPWNQNLGHENEHTWFKRLTEAIAISNDMNNNWPDPSHSRVKLEHLYYSAWIRIHFFCARYMKGRVMIESLSGIPQ